MKERETHVYEFDPFRLDAAEGVLLHEGKPVPLTPKAFQTLLVLVRNSGRVVEKDYLMKAIWPETIVEEVNLANNVSLLRRVFGERHGAQQYIQTVPRRGYRFAADVREIQDHSCGAEADKKPSAVSVEEAESPATGRIEHSLPGSEKPSNPSAVNPTQQLSVQHTLRVGAGGKMSGAEFTSAGSKRQILLAIAALLVVMGVAFGLYRLAPHHKSSAGFTAPSQRMKVRRLSLTGKATAAAISPDGKYVIHAIDEGGRQSLWLKHEGTFSSVQLAPPAGLKYIGLTFSPDSNLIYYVAAPPNSVTATVYRMPVLGGTPIRVADTVSSSISLSPDGRRLAFVRSNPRQAETSLWVAHADGSGEAKLSTRTGHESFIVGMLVGPAWSPDGEMISCPVAGMDGGTAFQTVVALKAADGTPVWSPSRRWKVVEQGAWLNDTSGLILVAAEDRANYQIWQFTYPGGEAWRITNDSNNYHGVSLSADSAALVTVRLETPSSVWVAPGGGETSVESGGTRKITPGNMDGHVGLAWTPDDRIIYTSLAGGGMDLWSMDVEGGTQHQLTADAGANVRPSVSPDGRHIVFVSNRTGANHIWRVGADGSNPTQLTHGTSEGEPTFSGDGQWIVHTSHPGPQPPSRLWKVPVEGGDPAPITDGRGNLPAVSPDGKSVAFRCPDPGGTQSMKICVTPFDGGQPVKVLDVPPTAVMWGNYKALRWTPDGSGVAYIDVRDGTSSIYSQPIDGSPPRRLATFESEHVLNFAWSRGGRWLALARGTWTHDVVLMKDFR